NDRLSALINKIESFIFAIIYIATIDKYMYGQKTGEIITESFVIEEKKVLKESSRRSYDEFIIITDDKRFKVNQEQYYDLEVGDKVSIKYNDKTLFVRDIENDKAENE